MKFLGAFVAFAVLALSNASVAPLHTVYSGIATSKLIQGPSSRTTIVGPDGSAISSVAPGGSIVTEEDHGVVAHTAPVVAAAPLISAYSAPIVAHSAPLIAPAASIVTHSAPLIAPNLVHTAYSAPLLAHSAGVVHHTSGVVARTGIDTVVAGPSGTISTSEGVVGHSAPLIAPTLAHTAYAAPLLAHSAPVLAHAGLATGVVARTGVNTVVAGPSGTVSTSEHLVAPGLYGSHVIPSAYAYGNHLVL